MSDKMTESPQSKRARAWLWPTLAIATAALTVVSAYLIIRFVSSPFGTAIPVVALLLIALTALGYLGAKRGHAAPFVAVALILPYLLAGVAAYASAQRVATEVGGLFGDATSSSSDEATGRSGTDRGITDQNADGVDDFAYDGQDCSLVENGKDQFDECLANGGFDPSAGDGATSGGDTVEGGGAVDGEAASKIDGGTYTWGNGVTLTMKVTHKQPYGSTDDFCGDGSCGIANPDDLTWVIHYKVSVPQSVKGSLDPSSCPGDLHIVDGNDDKSFGLVAGDFESEPGGSIRPGATKSGDAEYYIEEKALGKQFYLESYCGDPDNVEEAGYFEQAITK